MMKKVGLQLKVTAVITGILVIMFIVLTLFNAYSLNKISREFSSTILEDVSKYEATDIEKFIRNIIDYTDGAGSAIKGIMSRGNYDRAYLESIVVDTCLSLPSQVVRAGIALRDGIYKNNKFSVYISRKENGDINVDTISSDEDFKLDFYTVPINTKKYNMTDLYFYDFHGKETLMFTYSIPLFVGSEVVGVFFADVVVTTIQDMIKDFKSFDKATSFIMDSSANIVAISEEGKSNYIGKSVYELYPFYKEENILAKLKDKPAYLYRRKDPATKIMNANIFSEIEVIGNKKWYIRIQVPESVILKSSRTTTIIMTAFSLAIIILLAVFISIIIKRMFTNIMKALVIDLNKISMGDISISPPKMLLSNNDEWGDIARSIKSILDNLNNTVHKVKESADNIKSSSNEIAEGNSDLSHRTESQAASLEETASSMEEMASTIKASAEHSVSGNKMMIDSRNAVENAGIIIETTTKSIEEVFEASTKISAITKMIESIALQTNILALNAAVEAARAGEQGRGFAVVASEVRNLAQTTQTSVKDISNLIEDSEEKIKRATESARESKEIFDEIKLKIEETSKIMNDISETAIEQQSGVDQVNRAVSDMDTATQQNAALVEEAAASSEALLIQANSLVKVVSFFKLSDEKVIKKENKDSFELNEISEDKYKKEVKLIKEKTQKDDLKNKNNESTLVSKNTKNNKYEDVTPNHTNMKSSNGEFGKYVLDNKADNTDEFESF